MILSGNPTRDAERTLRDAAGDDLPDEWIVHVTDGWVAAYWVNTRVTGTVSEVAASLRMWAASR